MADKVDLIVKNGTVVTPDATVEADLAIDDGKFVAIAARGRLGLDADEVYDARASNPGAMLMEFIRRRSRILGIVAILVASAGTAIAIASPRQVADHSLGTGWQCSRTLFAVTCSHKMTK